MDLDCITFLAVATEQCWLTFVVFRSSTVFVALHFVPLVTGRLHPDLPGGQNMEWHPASVCW